MINDKFKYIWKTSGLIYSGFSIKNILYRFKYFLLALLNWSVILRFLDTENNECLRQELLEQQDKLGILVWPYIHKGWSFEEKCTAIQTHYLEVSKISALRISVGEKWDILDLSHIRKGLKVVIDRGIWFRREGELVLNIYIDQERIYSLTFSFGRKDNQKILYIGGVQGVTIDNIMEIYKEITKALFGMRPRDFLLNIIRIISSELEIDDILAISNKKRIHNHSYFSREKSKDVSINYDRTWIEQNGKEDADGFFHMKPALELKSIEDISSKKRSMYRKRYALLDELVSGISTKLK